MKITIRLYYFKGEMMPCAAWCAALDLNQECRSHGFTIRCDTNSAHRRILSGEKLMLSFFSIHLSYVPRQAGLRLDSNQRPILSKRIEVTALYTTTLGDAAEDRTRNLLREGQMCLAYSTTAPYTKWGRICTLHEHPKTAAPVLSCVDFYVLTGSR